MLISRVRVAGFRSIEDSGWLRLGPVTILIGRNNTGKSALLRAIYLAQDGSRADLIDLRLRATAGFEVEFGFEEPIPFPIAQHMPREVPRDKHTTFIVRGDREAAGNLRVHSAFARHETLLVDVDRFGANRPHHLIVPVFARRKSSSYDPTVRNDIGRIVQSTDYGLTSRIAMLTSGEHAEGRRYRELMDTVLNLRIGTIVTDQGQQPGVAVTPTEMLYLDRMGEGVSSVITILAELASPGPRLFLIEEPENDLHPGALRSLLEVITDALPENQFILSTHSDVVVRHMGAVPGAQVYRTELVLEAELPATTYLPVIDSFDRLQALQDLGYDETPALGWLVFEESSAEQVVRDALIPLFAPRLAALRTVSAAGAGNLPATLTGLHRTVLFLHLHAGDTPRGWVIADGDDAGHRACEQLRRQFSTWPRDRFANLGQGAFEEYYPPRFEDDVTALRVQRDQRQRSQAKGALAREVVAWALAEPEQARVELAESAREVIDLLRRIERDVAVLAT